MKDMHGSPHGSPPSGLRDFLGNRAELLTEPLAAPGLSCELFRCARAANVALAEAAQTHLAMAESLVNLTAADAVGRIARGELRAENYASRLLERYHTLKALNAVTWIDEARVLEDARTIDTRRRRGEALGSLGGLPVIVKDNIDVAGTPTAAATASFRRNIRTRHAAVAQRLFDQGAVFFAKANMHELAGGGTSSNPLTGVVANPYDPKRIPGGSSGGTAAAIAARMVPAGLGSDTAGSVRIPAALSGITGLRPTTYGGKLYSDDGMLPLASDLDTIGPMARTVLDVALLHAAITGTPVAPAADLRGVRIGVPRSPYWEEIDSDVAEVAERALEHLRDAGTILIDVDASGYYSLASDVYGTLVMYGIKEDLNRYIVQIGARTSVDEIVASIASQDTKTLFERARGMSFSSPQVEQARSISREKIAKVHREMFRSHGLAAIIFPTAPVAAPLINVGGDTALDEIEINGKTFSEVPILIRNTHVTGALGAPGLALAAGLTSRGLPVGLELDGLPGQDSGLLALGMAVERAWPPLPAPHPGA